MKTFFKVSIFFSSAILVGCINNGVNPGMDRYNESFLDAYTASLTISTPGSATATFPDRDIFIQNTGSKESIAKLKNVKVTVIRTEDIPGRPAWLSTLIGIIDGSGNTMLETSGINGLIFEVILKNPAGGETGSWITQPLLITCVNNTSQINASNRFDYNIIDASTKASIDISEVSWSKCP